MEENEVTGVIQTTLHELSEKIVSNNSMSNLVRSHCVGKVRCHGEMPREGGGSFHLNDSIIGFATLS